MGSYVFWSTYFISLYFIFNTLKMKYKDNKFCGTSVNMYLFFMVGLMIVMASFRRYDIGYDTGAYYSFFEQMCNGNFYYDKRMEIGYRLLNIIVSKISSNYTFFLFIIYFFQYSVLCAFAKRVSIDIRFFIMASWLFLFINFTGLQRQSLATAFVLLGVIQLINEKKNWFIFLCIIAALFHVSALVILVLLILKKYEANSKNLRRVFSLFFVFLFLYFVVLEPYISQTYYGAYLNIHSGVLAVTYNTMFALTPIILEKKVCKKSIVELKSSTIKFYGTVKWASVIYIYISMLALLSSGASRLVLYFLPLCISYWSIVISCLSKWNRRIIVGLFVCVLLCYQLIAIVFKPEWNNFFPFYFIWQ